jgi:hypothetical protein
MQDILRFKADIFDPWLRLKAIKRCNQQASITL